MCQILNHIVGISLINIFYVSAKTNAVVLKRSASRGASIEYPQHMFICGNNKIWFFSMVYDRFIYTDGLEVILFTFVC